MRKKEGCNIPSRVRYQRGTTTSNNANTVQRALNKTARGNALTREEVNAHRLAAHRGARMHRRQARRTTRGNHPPNLTHDRLPPNGNGNNAFNMNEFERNLNRVMGEHRLAQARNKNKNKNRNGNGNNAFNLNEFERNLNRVMEEHRLAQARNKNKNTNKNKRKNNTNNNNNNTEALIRRLHRTSSGNSRRWSEANMRNVLHNNHNLSRLFQNNNAANQLEEVLRQAQARNRNRSNSKKKP